MNETMIHTMYHRLRKECVLIIDKLVSKIADMLISKIVDAADEYEIVIQVRRRKTDESVEKKLVS